jgi:hypothetical protein
LGFAEFPVNGSCSLLRPDDMDDPERRNAAFAERSEEMQAQRTLGPLP